MLRIVFNDVTAFSLLLVTRILLSLMAVEAIDVLKLVQELHAGQTCGFPAHSCLYLFHFSDDFADLPVDFNLVLRCQDLSSFILLLSLKMLTFPVHGGGTLMRLLSS